MGIVLWLVLVPVIALVPADTAQAQPANSAWPMFRQNAQHNGRSPYSCPASPVLKCLFTTEGVVRSSPAIGPDGTIYVGSWDTNLYAINPNGSLSWNFSTGSTIDLFHSPAIGADGTIYVPSSDRNLYAINPNGSEKWRFFRPNSRFVGSPTIGADGTIYIGCDDSRLYALNPDGSQSWNFTAEGSVGRAPAIGADGTIYVGASDWRLYAINPDGTQRWNFTAEGPVSSSPAIGADGTIYVAFNDSMWAVNPDGSPQWRLWTGTVILSSPAIGTDGSVYFGCRDGKLYARKSDGTYKWTMTTYSMIESSPAIGADGTIYVGNSQGDFYGVNPADGSLSWSFTAGWGFVSSPAIGADGTIYIGSDDHKLYAIGALHTLNITSPFSPAWSAPCSGSDVTDPGWGTFIYARGTVVDLVAWAEEGCCFAEWAGDVGTIANTDAARTTITMNDDYQVTPLFEECPGPTVDPIPVPEDLPDWSDTPLDDDDIPPPFGGSCFIATAAYDTPMAQEIEILRECRDEYLLTNTVGQALVGLYYRVSPPMAEFITAHPGLKPAVRAGLLPAVAMSFVAINTNPAETIAVLGLLVLASVAVAVLATRWRPKRPGYH